MAIGEKGPNVRWTRTTLTFENTRDRQTHTGQTPDCCFTLLTCPIWTRWRPAHQRRENISLIYAMDMERYVHVGCKL